MLRLEPATMPTASPTQFAWAALATDGLGHGLGGSYLPEQVTATDPRCWLCGGHTGSTGWPQPGTFPPTFTNHNLARMPTSGTICGACVAMASKTTWESYVAAHNAAHPERPALKTGHAMSWRFYSHLFAVGGHECPTRERWRALLLEPPAPPFLAVIATSGKKHILFRGQVATSRDWFPLQMEDERLWIDRAGFARCLDLFERLYQAGYSKDEIASGRYSVSRVHSLGHAAWREIENMLRPWRERDPDYVRLATFVAYRPPREEASDA